MLGVWLELELLFLLYDIEPPQHASVKWPRGATRVHLGRDVWTQFFEKTHFEGIQYVKFIPIMNGLPIKKKHP